MTTPISGQSDTRREYYADRALPPGPIIVATDGSRTSEPAFSAAQLLADKTGLAVEVLSVVEPSPRLGAHPQEAQPHPASVDEIRVDLQSVEIQKQLAAQGESRSKWPFRVILGDPPSAIARHAEGRRAEIVITGMNRHSLIDRLLGNETPLHTAQMGLTPLLAVTNFKKLPATALIALDVDSPGVDRFRESQPAKALLAELKTLYIVHVVPPAETWGPHGEYWDRAYGEAVNKSFDRLRKSLDLPTSVRIETISPNGDPAREILDFAAFAKVELIVAGRRQARSIQRRLGGGLVAKLLRGAPCSVLLLPERPGRPVLDRPLGLYGRTESSSNPEAWESRLRDFTARNAGRRVNVEIDDRELGAQTQATAYPLLGIDYDGRNDHVDILLGQTRGTRHLSHRIPRPTEIDIQIASDGTDEAMRVAYFGGQILLTFAN